MRTLKSMEELGNRVIDGLSTQKGIVVTAGVVAALSIGGLAVYTTLGRARKTVKKYPASTLPEGAYDVVIVGAGPSGSTTAYYLAKDGVKVALLEKEHFPRDKYCANAVCGPGLGLLKEMGVLQQLIDNNEIHFADSGGIVSPAGLVYIGASQKVLGHPTTGACKRLHLDTRIAKNAAATGADLKEGFEVDTASFDAENGLWTVTSTSGVNIVARALVCADGATSRLASKLGYCTEAPRGVCSRAFVEPGSHNCDFDGVIFYHRKSLPGYSAIFRHPNDELVYTYYLIPCGDQPTQCGACLEADLPKLHKETMVEDPFVRQALGPNPKMERMKAAPLRVGGQGLKQTYDDHIVIVGDAAGHTDPITGEGIHTAIMGGKCAAMTLLEARKTGDYSAGKLKRYQLSWMQQYGHDFPFSRLAGQLIYKYPMLLDACTSAFQQSGDGLLSKWGEVMTNIRPKSTMLRPDISLPLVSAIAREFWQQYVLGRPDQFSGEVTAKHANTLNGKHAANGISVNGN